MLNFNNGSSNINENRQWTSTSPWRNLKYKNSIKVTHYLMKLQCKHDKQKKTEETVTRLRAEERDWWESEKRASLTKSHSFQFNQGTNFRECDDLVSSSKSGTSLNPNNAASIWMGTGCTRGRVTFPAEVAWRCTGGRDKPCKIVKSGRFEVILRCLSNWLLHK